MPYQSARHFLGQPAIDESSETVVGFIESITLNPKIMVVDGFLVGKVGEDHHQSFLPRECVAAASGDHLIVHDKPCEQDPASTRVLGLQAWTIQPKFLVGFVYDFEFSLEDGAPRSFVIHQLIRTWRVPATAVVQITPKTLLINNDMTIKLKLTPYPSILRG